MKRTFEYVEGTSRKFWQIERDGTRVLVTFGRIGSKGQTKLKEFPDEAAAQKECGKLVKEKLAKGYEETTPPQAPATAAVPPLRAALEAALVENPDDLAAHSAYADYLMEQGDPRGEFIQVQLALEDEKLPRPKRARLEQRERELLDRHGKAWLGGLANGLTGEETRRHARGWLDTLCFKTLSAPAAVALARAPEARLLRHLAFDTTDFDLEEDADSAKLPEDVDEGADFMELLAASPYLGNVRVLRAGEEIDPDFEESFSCRCQVEGVEGLIARLPRLEELYVLARIEPEEVFPLPTLANLRVLQLYNNHDHPFELLGANPALRNLTTLLCHPACYSGNAVRIRPDDLKALCQSRHLKSLTHLRLRLTELGDEGVRTLIDSGMLKRLKVLDLRLGSVTDVGAGLLTKCRYLKNLEFLNLSRNALTQEGIAKLAATGVKMNVENQHVDDDEDWYEVGDYE
jgi:uncharacterized protein (TIGR02996 family)